MTAPSRRDRCCRGSGLGLSISTCARGRVLKPDGAIHGGEEKGAASRRQDGEGENFVTSGTGSSPHASFELREPVWRGQGGEVEVGESAAQVQAAPRVGENDFGDLL